MNLKLIIVSYLCLITYFNNAQNCIPVAIVFTTQAQVDAFPNDYPGCTIIDGNVGITGNDITNIDSLSQITKINGSLQILNANGLTNLDGFVNITSINGNLKISFNQSIFNIGIFNSIITIGGIEITNNSSLFDINTFNSLVQIEGDLLIEGNNNLAEFDCFSSLTFINGDVRLNIPNVNNLNNFNTLTTINGNITLFGFDSILNFTSFNALIDVGGELNLNFPNVTVFDGFNALIEIGLDLNMYGFYEITSFTGFSALLSVNRNLNIYDCIAMPNINTFNSLTIIGSRLYISNNSVLTEINGFQNLGQVGNIFINENSFLSSISGLDHSIIVNNCIRITGNTFLSNCNVESVCNKIWNNGCTNISGNSTNCISTTKVFENCGPAPDGDGDGLNDFVDNCPSNPNADQSDWNNDGVGDACQDSDGDSIMDSMDNCRELANIDQLDCDGDGIGDACTNFILDTTVYACFYYTWETGNDSTYYESGIYTFDTTYANGCTYSKTLQLTITNSGSQYSSEVTACNLYAWEINDSIYTQSGTFVYYINECFKATLYLTIDSVGTNTHQYEEHCNSFTWVDSTTYTASGTYYFFNTVNNNCPDTLTLHLTINGGPDDDNDGLSNDCDNCPLVANTDQLDCNNNGVGDACEATDTDCDGIFDTVDNCPNLPNPFQTDLNNNGLGDACEDFPRIGFNNDNPLTEFHLSNGTLYLDNPEKGIILKNYQGQCFILKMNGSVLSTTQITCP